MKLSEAMRLGATMHPQIYGDFVNYDDHGGITGTCAFGGANLAAGRDVTTSMDCEWAGLEDIPEVACPGFSKNGDDDDDGADGRQCYYNSDIEQIIQHLNDDHKWTRERIADFVELHEPIESAPWTEDTPYGEMLSEVCEASIPEKVGSFIAAAPRG